MFPFQYGLSYSTFSAELKSPPSAVTVPATGSIDVTVAVTNTGSVPAKTVIGVYYRKPLSSFVRWHRMLASFGKTTSLSPSKSTDLKIPIDVAKMLASYNPVAGVPIVESGLYIIEIVMEMGLDKPHDPASFIGTFNLTVT